MGRLLGIVGLVAGLWLMLQLAVMVMEKNGFGASRMAEQAGDVLGAESTDVSRPKALTDKVRDRVTAAQEKARQRLARQLGSD